AVIPGLAVNLDVVLHQHAVVQYCHTPAPRGLADFVKVRGSEDNVVALPFARLARSVDQRRVLFVDRTGLPVEVGWVLVRIEHLDFVMAHQEDAAVAAALAVAFDFGGGGPFYVQLAIAEFLFGGDVARAPGDLDVAAL